MLLTTYNSKLYVTVATYVTVKDTAVSIAPQTCLQWYPRLQRKSCYPGQLLTQELQQGKPHVQALLQLQAWWMSYPPASREDADFNKVTWHLDTPETCQQALDPE